MATASDLVRFAAAFDQPQDCKLLTATSIEAMLSPPDGAAGHDWDGKVKKVYYGCGWHHQHQLIQKGLVHIVVRIVPSAQWTASHREQFI